MRDEQPGDREAAGAIAGMRETYGAPAGDLREAPGVKSSGFLTPDEVTDLERVARLLWLNGAHSNSGSVSDILARNKGTHSVPLDYLVVDPTEL
jgi:hypothetical protein